MYLKFYDQLQDYLLKVLWPTIIPEMVETWLKICTSKSTFFQEIHRGIWDSMFNNADIIYADFWQFYTPF